VALSAAAGTALFASLQKETASVDLRLALGLISVLAGVLAALQTFLGSASVPIDIVRQDPITARSGVRSSRSERCHRGRRKPWRR
jgi:hypothetical protein